MLGEHWECVEADFQRFYGLDLRVQFVRQPLRRLCVLVFHLPASSATAEAQQVWEVSNEFGATSLELLWEVLKALRAIAGDKQAHKIKPLKVPRPWTEKPRVTTDPEAIKAFFS